MTTERKGPRIYCAIAQPIDGGVPVTAISTVHLDDYETLERERNRLRSGLERIAAGDVHGVTFADDDLISAYAREVLDG